MELLRMVEWQRVRRWLVLGRRLLNAALGLIDFFAKVGETKRKKEGRVKVKAKRKREKEKAKSKEKDRNERATERSQEKRRGRDRTMFAHCQQA